MARLIPAPKYKKRRIQMLSHALDRRSAYTSPLS